MIQSFVDGPLWYFSLFVFVAGVLWRLTGLWRLGSHTEYSEPRGSAAGGGLRRHGKTVALQTRPTQRLEDAILYCTHESMFVDEANLVAFRRIAAKSRLQRFGGDCYAYCMLALGQIDLVVEDTLQPYDIVPLIPIIEAAGGVVTDARGKSPVAGGFVVAAASRQLHEEAMSLL